MKLATTCAFFCGLVLASAARADVTLNSKMDFKLASFLPPQAAQGMSKQLGETMGNTMVLRVKGQRSTTNMGPLTVITDRGKGTITLVDNKGKRFATSTIAEYGDRMKAAMPQLPPEAQKMFEGITIDAKTDKTGNTAVIKGIKTEETVLLVTVTMPGPMAAMGGINMEMHVWGATKEELDRVPALKEAAEYMSKGGQQDMDAMMSKLVSALPGMGEKLKGPMEEMRKASSPAVLRREVKVLMPASAKMMGAKDPNEPMTQFTIDLVDFSSDPIPDSVFETPPDYQSATLEELISMITPRPPAPAQKKQFQEPQPAVPQEEVRRVGNGVTAPKLLRKIEPEFSEEARAAHHSGTVTLYVQINPEGKAVNMRVLHSLGMGLDEKALEAVRKWTFQPGMKDGRPVTVEAQIEVNFRFLDDPVKIAEGVPGGPVYRIVNGVSAPVLMTKVEPEYSEEARAAKYQGTVLLKVQIDPEGKVAKINVARALGMGLDEKAMEAVRQWKFKPAMKDGQPVTVESEIEVSFRMQ
jgi:TonB family protein